MSGPAAADDTGAAPADGGAARDGAPVGYADAVAELEAILVELEVDDADVDVLAVRVRRAAELIRACRERIAAARFEVEQVVAELDGDDRG